MQEEFIVSLLYLLGYSVFLGLSAICLLAIYGYIRRLWK